MPTLSRDLRRQFEATIIQARRVAEKGARKALEQLAVHHHEPYSTLTGGQRALRNRLRAHGRQLGDKLDERRDTQTIDRLTQECAYEHWHRMLFARFLAESQLLIEPESGVAISLDECRELAREKNVDWLALASEFAVRMLPQIFRSGDPVLALSLPPETRQELEGLLKSVPPDVFTADDSLGWVYQFWQEEWKDQVNKSRRKIGADELAAVTQLFTEDYMVLFLLHNTLGAWWAGKVLARNPEVASQAMDEDALRAACSVGGYEWTYLRFVREDGKGVWRPAAGAFEGWPKAARDLKVLDPCMGSGHFLVFALPILVSFRMEQEGVSLEEAVYVVLRDNLFGLELDNRCTQIAAFNLAFTAWRMIGYRPLPRLNVACSGLSINAKEEDWLKLAGDDDRVRETMWKLYHLFQQAPVLGSLIDPKRIGGNLFAAQFNEVRSLLEKAVASEQADETVTELAVTAQGLVQAARILGGEFILVVTNVPYQGRGKQNDKLKEYCDSFHPKAKADLATCFVERCLLSCSPRGSAALVSPQNWLFLPSYTAIRKQLLRNSQFDLVVRLGANAFQDMNFWAATTTLTIVTAAVPSTSHCFVGLDASSSKVQSDKKAILRGETEGTMIQVEQSSQLNNPNARMSMERPSSHGTLGHVAITPQGMKTGDDLRFRRTWWEVEVTQPRWRFLHGAPDRMRLVDGACYALDFSEGASAFARPQGQSAWGKQGFVVKLMGGITAAQYFGEVFDSNVTALVPRDQHDLPALWKYVSSPDFVSAIRSIEQSVKVNNATVGKVSFNVSHWRQVGRDAYPNGLPTPHSDDPTQWLFDGVPSGSEQSLQVAVARLVGYRWPRQRGSSFPDCPALGPDGLEKHADSDGIVCLNPAKGDLSAADRLRAMLADAFGSEWSGTKQAELLSQVGHDGETLEDWLHDGFFEQNCALFHERPFIWHIWDGLKNGFHALVNYHKLAAPKGEGRRTFEKLIYAYLGDWIKQQRDAQKRDIEGADARVAAAEHLKSELERILEGEPPYDIFVRWKPLHEQPMGWEPDLNDGVRINIRPFMTATTLNGRGKNACILRVAPKIKWEKDRGKEPFRAKNEFPWFWGWDESDKPDFPGGAEFDGNRWNDLHYSRAFKQAARERASSGGVEGGKPR